MRFLGFKVLIGESTSGMAYETLGKVLLSAKALDASYEGADFLWAFYQMGDFDRLETSILKFELWSSWHTKKKTEFNNASFIGADSALFFYYEDDPESFKAIQEQIALFNEKNRGKFAPIVIVCIFDDKRKSKESIMQSERFQSQLADAKDALAELVPIPLKMFKKKFLGEVLGSLFRVIVFKRYPRLAQDLNIVNEFWPLTLEELRDILLADRLGKRIKPRHVQLAEQKAKEEAERKAKLEAEQKAKLEAEQKAKEETEQKLEKEQVAEEEVEVKPEEGYLVVEEIDLETLDEEQLEEKMEKEDVAIQPDGKVLKLVDATPQLLVDLKMKGVRLPSKYIIPRHCPKCGNQNQNMIRETDDHDRILLEYPKIYGIKYICGACQHEWQKEYTDTLAFEN